MDQLLFKNFQRIWRGRLRAGLPQSQFNCISQESRGGLSLLTEIVNSERRHNHFRLEQHFLSRDVSNSMKQSPNIHIPATLVPHRLGCLEQRRIRQRAEEVDCIEKIRFPHSISACDAGEWTKSNVHSNQVLEALNF